MAKLNIVTYPSEDLKQKTKKISRFDSSTRKLAQDMLDTMYDHNGVGLAAPQVGILKRMMIIDVSGEDEPRKPIVFINPEIIETSGEMIGVEGCLSFPGVFFEVRRHSKVVVKFQNLSGKEQKLVAQDNLLCRAIQHEMDHLEGELFIDKAVSKLAADLELSKHGFNGEAVELQPSGDTLSIPATKSERQLVG
ncbi:MAG: peptide deformylase [Candidatus Obscuribacterales bacterium]|nr:peptide deformylase [Candidatus Obscuribacterales bacterium]